MNNAELLSAIAEKLPEDWHTLQPEFQVEALLLAADAVLQPQGDWILLNAAQTMRELLTPPPA